MNINKKTFNSIEEVKEFISSPVAKNGAIHLSDTDGKSIQMTMDEFVNAVGLDNAAKFILENSQHMSSASLTKEEADLILKKFLNNPDSLSEEERALMHLIANSMDKDSKLAEIKAIITLILKSIITTDSNFTKNISSLTSIFITILENALISSTHLSAFKNNEIAMNEIVKKAKESITIADDVDDATLLLGMIHIMGDRCLSNKNIGEIDYHELSEIFDLDMEFLFGEEPKTSKPQEEMNNLFKEEFENVMLNKAREETKSSSAIVEPDIRQILKEDNL